MRRVIFTALLVMCAGSQTASADGYDSFATGVSAYERQNDAEAITAFTSALASPDLAPGLKVTAYVDRARSYLHQHQCSLALADMNAAKALKPGDVEITLSLAAAQSCGGDYRAAEASLTVAMAADSNPILFYARGRARWAFGDFTGAAADFAAIATASPRDVYPAVWLAVAQSRAGNLDTLELKRHASDLDLDKWPGPIIELYLGQATPDQIAAAAASGDPKAVINQQCEANFYIGEWKIAHNDLSGAKPLIQSAMDKCPDNFVEHEMAKAEMARLK